MEWIDACCVAGSDRTEPDGEATAKRLLTEMERLRINKALVLSRWSPYLASDVVNVQLFDDCSHSDAMLAVPEVTPEGGEHFLDRPQDAIDDFISRGAVAGTPRCQKNDFTLSTWCSGNLLAAMQERRLPLMVWLNDDLNYEQLFSLLGEYTDLPILLQAVPRDGYQRRLFPLMERFSNLVMVCWTRFSLHLGLEYMVERLGHEQIVWGSNYPESEGGAGISGVTYADLSEEAISAIAGGNMIRLLEGVDHG
jgi:hypothetical protein